MAMVKGYAQSLLIITAFSLFISCSTGRADYESAVLEWTGKEIVIPDSLPLVGGGWYVNEPANFTIVAYYDSEGCTGCRMKLPFWKEFMDRVDSLAMDVDVDLILIAESKDEESLLDLVEKSDFGYSVANDVEGLFYKVNKLPDEDVLRTFLLDSTGKVVTLGNPTMATALQTVYLNHICEDEYDGSRNEKFASHDFGELKPAEVVSHVFTFKNDSPDTLSVNKVLTSCECTEASVNRMKIFPSESYNVNIEFKDTVPGEFYRTVRILFKENRQPVNIELTGTVSTKIQK